MKKGAEGTLISTPVYYGDGRQEEGILFFLTSVVPKLKSRAVILTFVDNMNI